MRNSGVSARNSNPMYRQKGVSGFKIQNSCLIVGGLGFTVKSKKVTDRVMEPPESLFVKELRRRGMAPTRLGEGKNRSINREDEAEFREEDGGRSYSRRKGVIIDAERDTSNQRETSMDLNSEGLDGLVPRAKVSLTLGGTFFLRFWPLILATVAFFSALYLYFGPEFVHDGSKTPIAPPQYVDPYALLEEDRI